MDSGEEGRRVFSVAGCDTAPSFEVKAGILNKVAELVERFTIVTLLCAVFLWRDNRRHPLLACLSDHGNRIIASIRGVCQATVLVQDIRPDKTGKIVPMKMDAQ